MTDTTQIVYLDCNRQNSKKSDTNTNEWEYKIGDEAMVLPPGTQVSIQNALINKRGLSGGSIIIDEDIKEQMSYHYYKSDNECWRPAGSTPPKPPDGGNYLNIYNSTRGEHLNPMNKFLCDTETNTTNDGVYAGLGKGFRNGGNNVARYDTDNGGTSSIPGIGNNEPHIASNWPNCFGDTRGIGQIGEQLLQDYRRVGLSETPMMAITTKTWDKKLVGDDADWADSIDKSDDPTLPYDPTTSTYFVPRVGTSTIFIPRGTYGISELAQLITDQVNGKLVDVESGNFNKSAYQEKLELTQGEEGARQSLNIAGLGNNRTYIRVLPEFLDETGSQGGKNANEGTTPSGAPTVPPAGSGYKPVVDGWQEKHNLARPFNIPQYSYCSSYTASWNDNNAADGPSTLWNDTTGTYTGGVADGAGWEDPPNDGLLIFTRAIDSSANGASGASTDTQTAWTPARTIDANGDTLTTKFQEYNGYLFIPFTQEVIKYARRKFHPAPNPVKPNFFLGFHGLTRGCYGTTARPIPRGVFIEKYQCAVENKASEYNIDAGKAYRQGRWRLPDPKAGMFTDTYHFNRMCKTLITPPRTNTNTIETIRKTRMNLLCSQQLQDKTQMNPPAVAYPPADNTTPVWSSFQNYPNTTAEWIETAAAAGANPATHPAGPNHGKGLGTTITNLNGGFNYKACRNQMPLQYIRPQKNVDINPASKPTFFNPVANDTAGDNAIDMAGSCINLNNTDADYDPARQGYYIGTPEFNLSYDSSSSSYVVDNLHQSWRIPDYDNYGNEIENGGETAVLLRRVCDFAKGQRAIDRLNPDYGISKPNIESLAEELIDCLEQPKQREGGIAVFNWATLAAREFGDKDWTNPDVYNQDMTDLLEWEDYFTTKTKAKAAWKKTLWGRIGFRYEQLQDRDFFEQNKSYDRPIDEKVRVRGATTRADVDMGAAPSVATAYNPSVKPKIPNKPNAPIAPRTYDNLDINTAAQTEGTKGIWLGYGTGGEASYNYGVRYKNDDDRPIYRYSNNASYFGSFWKYSTAAIILAKGRPIRAYDLPILSQQGYYIITADILDQHEDSVKKGRNMPLLGVVPLSGEATNDFLNAVEPLTHLISQEKVVNSIKFKVLYPNLMNPEIDDNSSVILKIVRPVAPPTQSVGGKSAPKGESEPPPAKGNKTSATDTKSKTKT